MVASLAQGRRLIFPAFFAVYTAAAVFLLVLGLGAAFATADPVREALERWSQAGGMAGAIWETTARAARLSQPPLLIVLDYGLSILNVGCGLFLFLRRPHDWVARLLALAMIGTAMGYNYQTHSVMGIATGSPQAGGVPAARILNFTHFFFHAVSGAAYIHALLLFPDGRLIPRQLKWLPAILYAIALEEMARTIWGRIIEPDTYPNPTPGLILGFFNRTFDARPLANFDGVIRAEVTFFIIFFGALIPLVGIASQVLRYRQATTAEARQQSRVMLYALTFAFSLGLLAVGLEAFRSAVFSPEASANLYGAMLRISPLLFAAFPVAVLVAAIRYRLFELELIIDRTMVYWPLTAVLAILFLGTLFLVQQLFRALIGEPSELAVACAAFVNIFLFQPLRKQVQDFIDRRFFGAERPHEGAGQIETSPSAPGVAPP